MWITPELGRGRTPAACDTQKCPTGSTTGVGFGRHFLCLACLFPSLHHETSASESNLALLLARKSLLAVEVVAHDVVQGVLLTRRPGSRGPSR